MIRCPYCRTELTETTKSCHQCQLDLERASAVMGPVPRLSPDGLTDLTDTLTSAERRQLHNRMGVFSRHFPQSRILIVVNSFSDQFPLGVHLFWLFNTAGLSSHARKQGDNRDVLIGLDLGGRRVGLTIGYGLEPFLEQAALDKILERSLPQLMAGDFTGALLDMIDDLSDLFRRVSRDLPEIFGLEAALAAHEKHADY